MDRLQLAVPVNWTVLVLLLNGAIVMIGLKTLLVKVWLDGVIGVSMAGGN